MDKIRLQFRHRLDAFKTREEAIEFLDSLVKNDNGSAPIGESKMGEPIVVAYGEGKDLHAILAIGKKDGVYNMSYQYIDYDYIDSTLAEEIDRATKAEKVLTDGLKSVAEDLAEETVSRKKKDDEIQALVAEVSDAVSALDAETIKSIELNGVLFEVSKNKATAALKGDDVLLQKDSYVAPNGAVENHELLIPITEGDTLAEIVKKLDYRNAAEVVRAEAAEGKLDEAIEAETKRASEKENELSEKVVALEARKITSPELDPINVETKDNGETVITLKVADNNILKATNGELTSEVSLTLDVDEVSGEKTLHLVGVNGASMGTPVKVKDFLVDGMLDSVILVVENGERKLRFTWNTDADKTSIDIPVADFLIDYVAGDGITIEDGKISAKVDTNSAESNRYLKIDSARGLYVENIEHDINDAKDVAKAYTDSEVASAKESAINEVRAVESKLATTDSNVSAVSEAVDTLKSTVEANKSACDAEAAGIRNSVTALSQTVADNKSDIEGKLADATSDLSTFKAETGKNFEKVEKWQKTFTDDHFITKSVTSISTKDAKAQSLLFKVGEAETAEIYASNSTEDMMHGEESLALVINNLIQKVEELEKKNDALEDRIETLENKVKELENTSLKAEDIIGTEKEVKVSLDNKKVKIGFTEDAVFGPLTV